MHHRQFTSKKYILLSLLVLILMLVLVNTALAKPSLDKSDHTSPLHPTFSFLDENGQNVLESGGAVSTMKTCGTCHDTEFIADHSFHADVGLTGFSEPGVVEDGRQWDTSLGYFGKWNPMTYRYLTPKGDQRIDLGTAEWLQVLGARHPGGGPGVYSRDGELLTELNYSPDDPETNIIDPETGELVPWNWQESGLVELNCFLCHTSVSNNAARLEALQSGEFRWASSATLLGGGVIEGQVGNLRWNSAAFDENGELLSEYIDIQDPSNENCGQCHGLVHDEVDVPMVLTSCAPDRWRTETTGQIVSAQRLSDTGMNLADKETLDRSWDVHAERLVNCSDCHFAINNPVYYQEGQDSRPEHLVFDPRRIEIGEYLYRPVHEFARGESAQTTVAPEFRDTMRSCDGCHSIDSSHDWLPYKDRHVEALSCESCHIPKIYAFARQQYDWTVIRTDGDALMECRGIDSDQPDIGLLATGYDPVMMPRSDSDGNIKLVPHNLITSWFWVYGDPPRPVRIVDLRAVWLEGDSYHPEVVSYFDQNGDGGLDDGELHIDTPEKETFIAGRLTELGLDNPRITGEVQPYSIHHTVATDEWATRDCQTCHGENSRLNQPIQLASYVPAGVLPEFVSSSNTVETGSIYRQEDGALYYQPSSKEEGMYIIGHDAVGWIDLFGSLLFVATLLGVAVHGGLRFYTALRRPKHDIKTKRVYMYTIYNRLWHWLQTFVIVGLLFTGLIIHKPDTFGIFSFRYVVLVHNILAAILVANATLSLFYHLASGEIQQFIPRPQGFFDQAITQAKFYLRGIFRDEPHPFEKRRDKKLNPLQQATYFGLLNVLLPLQVITGALIWGAQRWPQISNTLGGLPFLSPLHTLISWTLAAFVVLHVYLTTTGHTPTAAIEAMMLGWDEVEIPEEQMDETADGAGIKNPEEASGADVHGERLPA
jgi:thiosulfate reductase cytochrome b subunit